jgi:hypothetical protein
MSWCRAHFVDILQILLFSSVWVCSNLYIYILCISFIPLLHWNFRTAATLLNHKGVAVRSGCERVSATLVILWDRARMWKGGWPTWIPNRFVYPQRTALPASFAALTLSMGSACVLLPQIDLTVCMYIHCCSCGLCSHWHGYFHTH